MDDLDPDHKCLGHHIKLWADRYGVILEVKSGAVTDNYETFIITSQYKPEEIWSDEKTLEAIKRRFEFIDYEAIS